MYFYFIVAFILLSLADLILTLALSHDEIKFLFKIKDYQRNKFGVLLVTIIFSKIIIREEDSMNIEEEGSQEKPKYFNKSKGKKKTQIKA